MSTPNPILVAAAPYIVTALQAAKTLIANLGTDPAQVAAKAPGALAVFVGTLEMELPGLAASEIGAVQTALQARLDALIASAQAAAAAPTAK